MSCRSHQRSEWRGRARKAGFVQVDVGIFTKARRRAPANRFTQFVLPTARSRQKRSSNWSHPRNRTRCRGSGRGELLDDGDVEAWLRWIGAVR